MEEIDEPNGANQKNDRPEFSTYNGRNGPVVRLDGLVMNKEYEERIAKILAVHKDDPLIALVKKALDNQPPFSFQDQETHQRYVDALLGLLEAGFDPQTALEGATVVTGLIPPNVKI
jgi:hypothetical protein